MIKVLKNAIECVNCYSQDAIIYKDWKSLGEGQALCPACFLNEVKKDYEIDKLYAHKKPLRKNAHIEALEKELETLQQKHDKLTASYNFLERKLKSSERKVNKIQDLRNFMKKIENRAI